MSSIRLFLTISIIATVILANFLAALHGYQESMQEAEALFDRKLENFADFLSISLPNTGSSSFEHLAPSINQQPKNNKPSSDTLLYQVRNENDLILFQSIDFNNDSNQKNSSRLKSRIEIETATPFNFKLESSNDYINYANYRWRSITRHYPEEKRWVFVMEKQDVRYRLAESVILKSIYPIIIAIPTIGLIILLIVRRGLKPVRNLADKVDAKQAGNLTPIELDGVPAELNRLAERINDLLSRLDSSLSREKRFASDAAHELRTPIAALNIQMKNLIDEEKSDQQSVAELNEGVKRMSHLVEQILMLNRSSPDLYAEQFKVINLSLLLKELVAELYPLIEERSHEIELVSRDANDKDGNGRYLILGDKFALQTLFKNLILNSVKYTPNHGQILIILDEIGFDKSGNEEKRIRVSILDSGPGIESQEQNRIFERFYRVAGDRNQSKVIGCGLGLSIVKQIADLHQADIELSDSITHPQDVRQFESGLCVKISFSTISCNNMKE